MVRHLLGNASGTFSVNKFHGDLHAQGIPVAKDTLHAYLGHLQDAFLVLTIPIAAESERRRMVNPRKAYPVDPGLIAVFDRSGRTNAGHALEAVVAIELVRRGAEISYVRTPDGFEVDFLARYPGGRQDLIQVCADFDAPETRLRETRALTAAAQLYPMASLNLVVLTSVPSRDISKDIAVHQADMWLLMAGDE